MRHFENTLRGMYYRLQEAQYPTMSKILKKTKIPVAFFQGLWDNQTPAYNAQAIQVLAKTVWKKDNLKFWFFPKLGHVLDPRDSYNDLFYRNADPEALKKVSQELDKLFK